MLRWSLAAIFIGLSGLGGLFSFQTKLIYFPEDRQLSTCASPAPTEYHNIGPEQVLLTKVGSANLVVFFHGNAGSACNWRFLGVNHLVPLGYDTLVVEYPGYGGDPRPPSLETITAALPTIHQWIDAQDYETITVFGYSLGAAVGSLYAQNFGADQIILFAPFDSLYAVASGQGIKIPRRFLTEDYNNIVALQSVDAPIYILHGDDDDIIPVQHSATLAEALLDAGRDVRRDTLSGAGHDDLFISPEFDTMLQDILLFSGEN